MSNAKEDSDYLDAWRKLKDDHPEAYTVAAIAPGTGQVVAVADYADAMDRGNTADGVTAALSMIPGFRLAKKASKMSPASFRLKSQMNATERAIAPAVKKAPLIGKAAAAEQAAGYVKEKASSDEAGVTDSDAEYRDSWGREDRR